MSVGPSVLSLCLLCEDTVRRWLTASHKESSHQTPAMVASWSGDNSLSLELSSITVRIKFLFFKPPVYDILLWQPEPTNIHINVRVYFWSFNSVPLVCMTVLKASASYQFDFYEKSTLDFFPWILGVFLGVSLLVICWPVFAFDQSHVDFNVENYFLGN